jgi:hypothetical protein
VEQFGFRTESSNRCGHIQVIEWNPKGLKQWKINRRHFCDLEKAFDCIDHEVLLSKWEFYGINDKIKLWFKLYLSNRYQRVLITNTNLDPNEYSTLGRIRHLVLQGLVMGPWVLLYIYDFSKIVMIKLYLYICKWY